MRSGEFIQRKFRAWACQRHVALQGSAGELRDQRFVAKMWDKVRDNNKPRYSKVLLCKTLYQ